MPLQLNDSQRDFCKSTSQCIRLLAPAGCGKTASLLYRCLHLHQSATKSPPRFLIVTFTKAATVELQDRLNGDSEFEALRSRTNITTLNAYGWRRIRSNVTSPRLLSSPTNLHFALKNQLHPVWQKYEHLKEVVSKRGSAPRKLMLAIDNLKSMGFDHTAHTNFDTFSEHLDALQAQELDWRLNEQYELLTKIKVLDDRYVDNLLDESKRRRHFYDRFFKFWRASTKRLLDESTFTFEDQKYWCYIDLAAENANEDTPVLSGAARYNHVFVDEFQDINPLDLALVRELVERNRASITIVGDDDQAIFEWRGATPEYVLNPKQYFGREFRDYQLEINYRSPRNIVELSKRLIRKNVNRIDKKVRAANRSSNAKIDLVQSDDITTRLQLVTEIVNDTESPGKVAVIGRLRRQLIPYQVYFAGDGAPFTTTVDLDVFSSAAFEDLVSLLDVWSRSNERQLSRRAVLDAIALCDLIRKRPLGNRDRDNLSRYLLETRPRNTASAVDVLGDYGGPELSGKTHVQLHDAAMAFIVQDDVAGALRVVGQDFDGLQFDAERAEEDVFFTDPPLEQLASITESESLSVEDLIERIDAVKLHVQEYRNIGTADNGDELDVLGRPLHLMTATRSKGKEFDTVILLDTVEGIWPHNKASEKRQLEAERRLFYVAFTRAKSRVVLITSTDSGNRVRSRFLDELGL